MTRALILLIALLLLPAAAASPDLAQAEANLTALAEAGFSTAAFADLLSTADSSLAANDTTAAAAALSQFSARQQRAYRIHDTTQALDIRIGELNARDIDTREAVQLRATALAAFEKETYDEAESALFLANQKLTEREADARTLTAMLQAARENALAFLSERWPELLSATTALAALLALALILLSRRRTAHQLRRSLTERRVLVELMKKAQVARYQEGTLSDTVYRIKMQKHREQLQACERRIPVLRARLVNPFKRMPKPL